MYSSQTSLMRIADITRAYMPSASTRVLHRERVHHRGEHAHVVAGDAVHAGARQAGAAEDVAAADHDRDLHAQAHDFADLERDALEHLRVDAVVLLAQQRLAATA